MSVRRPCCPLIPAIGMILACLGRATCAAEEPTQAEERAFRAAVDRVAAAVVRIEPVEPPVAAGGEAAAGAAPSTGLVVDGDGWVLTTAFAVPAGTEAAVIVRADGGRQAARVVGRDRPRGIVLLRTEPLPGTPPLEAVPRGELSAGQWTIAVGRGWSHAQPGMSVGILSAVNRAWGRAVQTDAAVSPANYGGPLLDIRGRVIGMLAPLPADTAGFDLGTELYDSGIGFAVPLVDLQAVMPRLRAGDSLAAGLLGIGYGGEDRINGPPVIASVRQGSPAARSGLRPGDRIVEVDGAAVRRIADIRHRLMPKYAGDEVRIVAERGAVKPSRVTITATLMESLPPWRRAVIGVVPLPAGDDTRAVRVGWLLPDGPASRAGLAVGDEIVSAAVVDDGGEPRPTAEPEQFAGVLAGVEPGGRLRLEVSRDGVGRRVEVVTAEPPTDPPADGPPVEAEGEATVVMLETAEMTQPVVAVMPPPGRGDPPGLLVWFAPPHGPTKEEEATAWKAAAARHGVVVLLPGSEDPQRWARGDLSGVQRALQAVQARRPVDPHRIAVAGRGAGGSFAWLVAERFEGVVRGVALLDAGLPRQATVDRAEPGRWLWVLQERIDGEPDAAARRRADDRRRLVEAGLTVGAVAPTAAAEVPADTLCGWVGLLGLL